MDWPGLAPAAAQLEESAQRLQQRTLQLVARYGTDVRARRSRRRIVANGLDFSLSSLGLKASLRKWIYLEPNHFLSEAFRPSEESEKNRRSW